MRHECVRLIWGFRLALQKMIRGASIAQKGRREAGQGTHSAESRFSLTFLSNTVEMIHPLPDMAWRTAPSWVSKTQ